VNSSSPDWYSLDSVRQIRGLSRSALFRDLESLPSLYRRFAPNPAGRGRPQTEIHYTAWPDLKLAHDSSLSPQPTVHSPQPTVSADDLATAQLRLLAVREYLETAKTIPKAQALLLVSRNVSRKAIIRPVEIVERLPGGHERKTVNTVSLGDFSARTLRHWARAWAKRGDLLDLAPTRKGHTGRARKGIPDDLLAFVASLATSTARSDIKKAIAKARPHIPESEWPIVSFSTWRRRIGEADPSKIMASLGQGGVSRFRSEQSPDAARDYSKMRFNQLWQLDDVTQDFYCHSALDPLKVLRPYAYAIMRVATRQWISAVLCETPIVGDLVRAMVGMALVQPAGGIPEEIQFERGAIACDPELETLLTSLGIVVHRTTMDSGAVSSVALPDKGVGHFQGKAVIEANFRPLHNELFDAPGQVGVEERHSKPQRLDTLLAAAREAAKSGQPWLLPSAAQAMRMVFEAMDRRNNAPHSGLPEIIDAHGVKRRCSPNEYAAVLAAQSIRVASQKILPLFFRRGTDIEVTKNGIRFEKAFYGRFDSDVQALSGTTARVYGVKEIPDAIFVEQLGRCVERYVEPDYGADSADQIEAKKTIEKSKRSLYEKNIATAIEIGGVHLVEQTRFLPNPTPQREAIEAELPANLEALVSNMRLASAGLLAKREGAAAAWSTPDSTIRNPQSAIRNSRRGLLSREAEISAQVETLTLGVNPTQEESWKL
jgi:hypothetical protein